ncbi:MAG: hypothetical protein ACOCYR_02135, partial [Erythrobacter sp.]
MRIDDEDFTDLLVELESSFAISLPRDLRHVQTAGDLFAEILRCRQPDGAGERCDTAMAFYRMRRLLVGVGLDPAARPATELAGKRLPPPRRVASMIRRELGLQPPALVISTVGCVLAAVILVGIAALALWQTSFGVLALWMLVLPALALDRGGWSGEWATLGSLSEALAARNVAALAELGARNDETRWWRRFATMLGGIAWDAGSQVTDHRLIGPQTR